MDGPLNQEINEQIRAMMRSDPAAALAKIRPYLEETDQISLNIAITGEPGTGKSTFVNTFRGINNNDEGAAPTGCENPTTNPTSYHHPYYHNVTLWDLPGIGSTMWPSDKYVERVELEKFDFFIIISANRFRENDVKLAKEIQKMGKKLYFVRSKINHNLRDEKRSKRDFGEERTLKTIIEDCNKGLQELGIEFPHVFLVSIPDLSKHGLKELKSTFEGELPELKKHALCLAMSNLYLQVLNDVKSNFQAKIKYYSVFSAVGAAVPVPLLSAAVDFRLIDLAFRQYLEVLSLLKLSAITSAQNDDFQVTSTLSNNKPLKRVLILKVVTQVVNSSILIASMRSYHFSSLFRIPVVSALSFKTTYMFLNVSINVLVKKAHMYFTRALGLNVE